MGCNQKRKCMERTHASGPPRKRETRARRLRVRPKKPHLVLFSPRRIRRDPLVHRRIQGRKVDGLEKRRLSRRIRSRRTALQRRRKPSLLPLRKAERKRRAGPLGFKQARQPVDGTRKPRGAQLGGKRGLAIPAAGRKRTVVHAHPQRNSCNIPGAERRKQLERTRTNSFPIRRRTRFRRRRQSLLRAPLLRERAND